MPASLTAMIVSRDVLLVYAGLYIRYMSVQPPVSNNNCRPASNYLQISYFVSVFRQEVL